ncbi:hypothetical protein FRB99_004651, partial [Tulasnella sp. 403]
NPSTPLDAPGPGPLVSGPPAPANHEPSTSRRMDDFVTRLNRLNGLTATISDSMEDLNRLRANTAVHERLMAEERDRNGNNPLEESSSRGAVRAAYARIRERHLAREEAQRARELLYEDALERTRAVRQNTRVARDPSASVPFDSAGATTQPPVARSSTQTPSSHGGPGPFPSLSSVDEYWRIHRRINNLRGALGAFDAPPNTSGPSLWLSAANSDDLGDDSMTSRGRRVVAREAMNAVGGSRQVNNGRRAENTNGVPPAPYLPPWNSHNFQPTGESAFSLMRRWTTRLQESRRMAPNPPSGDTETGFLPRGPLDSAPAWGLSGSPVSVQRLNAPATGSDTPPSTQTPQEQSYVVEPASDGSSSRRASLEPPLITPSRDERSDSMPDLIAPHFLPIQPSVAASDASGSLPPLSPSGMPSTAHRDTPPTSTIDDTRFRIPSRVWHRAIAERERYNLRRRLDDNGASIPATRPTRSESPLSSVAEPTPGVPMAAEGNVSDNPGLA